MLYKVKLFIKYVRFMFFEYREYIVRLVNSLIYLMSYYLWGICRVLSIGLGRGDRVVNK